MLTDFLFVNSEIAHTEIKCTAADGLVFFLFHPTANALMQNCPITDEIIKNMKKFLYYGNVAHKVYETQTEI